MTKKVISGETQKAMAAFFYKTSIPRILKKMQRGEINESITKGF